MKGDRFLWRYVLDYSEKRRYPRFEGQFRVDLLNMGDDPHIPAWESVVPATALDISKEGLRIISRYETTIGAKVSAIVYYKEQGSVALCEVVWKRNESGVLTYGLFIKGWSKLDPSLERKLEELKKLEQLVNQPPSGTAVVTRFAFA